MVHTVVLPGRGLWRVALRSSGDTAPGCDSTLRTGPRTSARAGDWPEPAANKSNRYKFDFRYLTHLNITSRHVDFGYSCFHFPQQLPYFSTTTINQFRRYTQHNNRLAGNDGATQLQCCHQAMNAVNLSCSLQSATGSNRQVTTSDFHKRISHRNFVSAFQHFVSAIQRL